MIVCMTTTFDGTVALVTGGSRGIGAGIALRLAQDGADVALTYRQNAEQAATVVKQIEALGRRALAIQADGADASAVRNAVDRRRGWTVLAHPSPSNTGRTVSTNETRRFVRTSIAASQRSRCRSRSGTPASPPTGAGRRTRW